MSSNSIDCPIVLGTAFFSPWVLGQRSIDELSAWKNYFGLADFTIARRLAQAAVHSGWPVVRAWLPTFSNSWISMVR